MENSNSTTKKDWNNFLFNEILVSIFTSLNVVDLAVASLVCKSWNRACRDPSLWHKLDLSRMSSYCLNIPNDYHAWNDKDSSTKMTQFLKTPNLKRLVLPMTGFLTMGGVNRAMKSWGGLESITISAMVPNSYIFSAIGKYCKNITEMKFSCEFEEDHADAIIEHTPNLKVLSIRTIIVSMKALRRVLTSLEHLEAVNICHSLIINKSHRGSRVVVYGIGDLRKHFPSSCLGKLIFCEGRRCLRCKRRDTTPSRRYGCHDDIWRQDEITSLAH
ncbi:F-box/LRR-repeat protein, partial [Mucuna pruriens]